MAIHQATTHSVEEFFAEHARLTGLIRQVGDALQHCSGRAVYVCSKIEQFYECLHAHFEFEEEGGYFTRALVIEPRLQRLADRLSAEHRELAEQARELHDHASLCDGGELWWEQLRDLFASLVDDLQAHEEAENHLVQAAFLVDLGGED